MAAATALLTELGALDGAGRITLRRRQPYGSSGRPSASGGDDAGGPHAAEAALAADLAALLEERDPLRRPDAPADVGLRLAALAEGDPAADRQARCRASAGWRRGLPLVAGHCRLQSSRICLPRRKVLTV